MRKTTLASAAFLCLAISTNASAAQSCDKLASLSFPDAVVTFARPVAAGAFAPEKPVPMGARQLDGLPPYSRLPAFCRVAMALKPSPDSDIKAEIWMPLSGWNGRYVGSGNGGAAGFIRYPEMGELLVRGYAVAGTDAGHEGNATDWTFARGHPEKVVDLGYRAVHEMTVKAKAIVTTFYGQALTRSYWNGCSTGGRQGLSEAQRYPSDYDGIVAGAPANYTTRLNGQYVWVAQALHKEPSSFIPPTKLQVLHDAVLQACDAKDGVTDGVIGDPARCNFDPHIVACAGGERPDCLSSAQITAARAVYGSSRNRRTNDVLYPGLMPGSELGWAVPLVGQVLEEPSALALGFFKHVVVGDPNWDYRAFDFDGDSALADRRAAALNAIDPDLTTFFARGGKLVQYQGWADGQLSPQNTVNYYNSVVNAGTGSNSNAYRLFMIPGMDHCRGGDGTDKFDMLSAVVDWVEHRKAPERVIASRITNGKVDRTRPLCPYPQLATYKGIGSTDDAASFVCTSPR